MRGALPPSREKMTPGLAEKMALAIIGYTLEIEHWRGTRKLGQNKTAEVRLRAADKAEATGNAALAGLMRSIPD